jgi:hypothetical protein
VAYLNQKNYKMERDMAEQKTKSKKDTESKDQVAKAAAQKETEAVEMAVEGAAELAGADELSGTARDMAATGIAEGMVGAAQVGIAVGKEEAVEQIKKKGK